MSRQIATKNAQGEPSERAEIVVAAGYGLKIYIERGHLCIHDGIFQRRRTRRFHRATSGLRRLVVIGHTGFVTLEALKWLRDVGAHFAQIDSDGELIALSAADATDRPALRRAQVLAAGRPSGLEITRGLLIQKVQGHLALLQELPGSEDGEAIVARSLAELERAEALPQVLQAEAKAALAYWQAWTQVAIRFAARDVDSVPAHWLAFGQRHSQLTGSPRSATNPANAILNYLYSLVEMEFTFACHALGLDPGLGLFHQDRRSRNSLALDLIEAARPAVDAYVLVLLRERTFRRKDFTETPRGACRLRPSVASELAATAPSWQTIAAPIVESTAEAFAQADDVGPVPKPLTGARRSAAWGKRAVTPRVALPTIKAGCQACGAELPKRARRYCDSCLQERFLEIGESGRAAARAAFDRLRTDGRDPRYGGKASRLRAEKNRDHQKACKEWNSSRAPADPTVFREEIAPLLGHVQISALVAATGLSEHYCSLIRLGKRIPHPRHWEALRACGRSAECEPTGAPRAKGPVRSGLEPPASSRLGQ